MRTAKRWRTRKRSSRRSYECAESVAGDRERARGYSGDGARWSAGRCFCGWLRVEKEEGGDRMDGGLVSGVAHPTRRRGWSDRGPSSPVYGCHVVAVGG